LSKVLYFKVELEYVAKYIALVGGIFERLDLFASFLGQAKNWSEAGIVNAIEIELLMNHEVGFIR